MARQPADFPRRLLDLDPKTVELLARMNEAERRMWAEIANLDPTEFEHFQNLLRDLDATKVARLKQFLALPDEKWRAGFDIVTRSVIIWKVMKAVPWFVIALVGFLTAAAKLWEWFSPYIRLGGKG